MTLQIQPNVQVTATYRLSEAGGALIDDSERSGPLRYTHGKGQLVAALESALVGRRKGDKVTVTLTPEQAFGAHRPELVFEAVRDNLPPNLTIEPGMTLTPGGQQGRFSLKVIALTEKGAMLDGNHPYAGKTLTWELTITHLTEVIPTAAAASVDHEPIRWVPIE